MRRASRDYTKSLRGPEDMGSGGAGAPHEGPLHAPPPGAPAPHPPAAASRVMFVALLGLGLGQVVCSVALFLYFRAQVSAPLPIGRAHTASRSRAGGKLSLDGGAPQLLLTERREGTGEGGSGRAGTGLRSPPGHAARGG